MNQKRLVALVIAILIAAIWGVIVEIHSHSLKHGVVIGKGHNAAWVQTTIIYVRSGDSTITMPQIIYWPETWIVTIEGTNASGEKLTRNLSLGKSEYDKIETDQRVNAN